MLTQILLLVLSAVALYCTQTDGLEKWGPVWGMASQPFWIYETASADQYGMLANSLILTAIWGKGLWKYWIKDYAKR